MNVCHCDVFGVNKIQALIHGFSDHIFGICHLLGFRFAPRIRDLKDKRLYTIIGMDIPAALEPLVAGNVNLKVIRDYWEDILRLAASIKMGTVTTSVILRKLAAYPRQNGLALALRELGKLERTLFTLRLVAGSRTASAQPYRA